MSYGYYGHSDPTATAAIGAANKKLKDMESLSREKVAENYIEFSVNSVINAPQEDQLDTLVKRLGTIALSTEMSDTDASVFCHKLEQKTNGEYSYSYLINWYHSYKRYLQNGGPNGANNFSPAMIAKSATKADKMNTAFAST